MTHEPLLITGGLLRRLYVTCARCRLRMRARDREHAHGLARIALRLPCPRTLPEPVYDDEDPVRDTPEEPAP